MKQKIILTETQYNKLLLNESIADIIRTIFNSKINDNFLDVDSTKKTLIDNPNIVTKIHDYLMDSNKKKNVKNVNDLILKLKHGLNPGDKKELKDIVDKKIKNLLDVISVEKYGLKDFDEVIDTIKKGALPNKKQTKKQSSSSSLATTKKSNDDSEETSPSAVNKKINNLKDIDKGWYELDFKDNSKMYINIFRKVGNILYFYFQKNNQKKMTGLKGFANEFSKQLQSNKNIKDLRYATINLKDIVKENKVNLDLDEISIDAHYFNDKNELDQKSVFNINNLESIKSLDKNPPKMPDTKTPSKKISVEEFKDALENNENLKKALLDRPGLIGSLFNMPETGLIPTEDLLSQFSKYINKNIKKVDFIKFKSDNIITFRSDNSGDLKGLVAKPKFKDNGKVYVYTNLDKTVPTEKEYKYKLLLLMDYNKDVGNDRYGVGYNIKSQDGTIQNKEMIIQIVDYGDKKNKK